MRTFISSICIFLLATRSLVAAEPVLVGLELKDKSWFTDRSAMAVAVFDTVVDQTEDLPEDSEDCHFLDIEVSQTPDSKSGKSMAVIRFLPRKTGIITMPSIEFTSGNAVYQTRAVQMVVGEPQRSDKMKLAANPKKLRVYEGEPLRVDLSWDCALPAAALRDLRWNPECFRNPDVEVVVPRNTGAEETRMGLPLGGRRVEASRNTSGKTDRTLGHIDLPIYLRFAKPGKQVFSEMRLECAELAEDTGNFATYASYFNNALFEPVDTGVSYRRVYVTTPAFEIDVIPLPEEGKRADFSGLFDPLEIAVSVMPTEAVVGALMQVDIKVSGDAPHGMLDLPPLGNQQGLRGRFLATDGYGRLWHEKGTLFHTRLRALTTSVKALPSLRFQVFDPTKGTYRMLTTDAIPLVVTPNGGQDFAALNAFYGAVSELTDHPGGILQNLATNPMNDLLDQLLILVQRGFPYLLLAGPLAFFALLPWVRERRRRALDAGYRARAMAFAELGKLPADSPGKWPAFLRFMTASFGAAEKTWTIGDSRHALRSVHASEDEIRQISALHEAADAHDFSSTRPDARFANLDGLAKRVMRLLARSALLWMAAVLFMPSARADEWSDAEAAFQQALNTPAGSDSAQSAYEEAALKYQAAAKAGSHTGEAWTNAGNAWFQAGAMGRSISAYRNAQDYRPLDAALAKNLAAARALVGTSVTAKPPFWKVISAPWLKPLVVGANLIFWVLLLLTIRFRGRSCYIATGVSGIILLTVTVLYIANLVTARPAGVVIVDAIEARKGPSYAYAKSFNETLRDGLEFVVIENREAWKRIRLGDGRECWVPASQVEEWTPGFPE